MPTVVARNVSTTTALTYLTTPGREIKSEEFVAPMENWINGLDENDLITLFECAYSFSIKTRELLNQVHTTNLNKSEEALRGLLSANSNVRNQNYPIDNKARTNLTMKFNKMNDLLTRTWWGKTTIDPRAFTWSTIVRTRRFQTLCDEVMAKFYGQVTLPRAATVYCKSYFLKSSINDVMKEVQFRITVYVDLAKYLFARKGEFQLDEAVPGKVVRVSAGLAKDLICNGTKSTDNSRSLKNLFDNIVFPRINMVLSVGEYKKHRTENMGADVRAKLATHMAIVIKISEKLGIPVTLPEKITLESNGAFVKSYFTANSAFGRFVKTMKRQISAKQTGPAANRDELREEITIDVNNLIPF